jgi:hypothetical protein
LCASAPAGELKDHGLVTTDEIIKLMADELRSRQEEIDNDDDLRRVIVRVIVRNGRPRAVLFEKLTEHDLAHQPPAE